ncbi:Hypothetical protein SRAE_1000028700 [Strongyloides ratti]|uniref:Uncharacterized protein n=1 Tax=Strongyloides ratti TaxID=34506 RepID=A0A090KX65_STRRB|nr:Hypothetical protein SRAE_1000028700 [Strongyloides ratti]CEF62011.1 Hypothetical protein SRAE_1000028700 [Strongyloides ratti]
MIVAFFGPVLVLIVIYLVIYYIVMKVKKHFAKRYQSTKIPLDHHVGLDLEDVRMDSHYGELPCLIANVSILDTSSSITHSTYKTLKNFHEINPNITKSPDQLSDFDDRIGYDGTDDIFNINDNDMEDSSYTQGLRFKSEYSKKNN